MKYPLLLLLLLLLSALAFALTIEDGWEEVAVPNIFEEAWEVVRENPDWATAQLNAERKPALEPTNSFEDFEAFWEEMDDYVELFRYYSANARVDKMLLPLLVRILPTVDEARIIQKMENVRNVQRLKFPFVPKKKEETLLFESLSELFHETALPEQLTETSIEGLIHQVRGTIDDDIRNGKTFKAYEDKAVNGEITEDARNGKLSQALYDYEDEWEMNYLISWFLAHLDVGLSKANEHEVALVDAISENPFNTRMNAAVSQKLSYYREKVHAARNAIKEHKRKLFDLQRYDDDFQISGYLEYLLDRRRIKQYVAQVVKHARYINLLNIAIQGEKVHVIHRLVQGHDYPTMFFENTVKRVLSPGHLSVLTQLLRSPQLKVSFSEWLLGEAAKRAAKDQDYKKVVELVLKDVRLTKESIIKACVEAQNDAPIEQVYMSRL